MSFSIFAYYIITFITLSGFGVIFFNAESILFLCFVIFVALIMVNDPISATLDEQKQIIRSELVESMIGFEKAFISSKKTLYYKKLQLITCLKHMTAGIH